MDDKISQAWSHAISEMVRANDLEGYMDLYSPNIHIFGLPNEKEVDFEKLFSRRKREFRKQRLVDIRYNEIKIITTTPKRLTFNAQQSILATDGSVAIVDTTITLENEHDEQWRAVEEQVNAWKNMKVDLEAG